jgi:hypothetical protein
MPRQRSWDADQDGVSFNQAAEVGRGTEPALLGHIGNSVIRNMSDGAATSPELLDADFVDIEAKHLKARLRCGKRQRQSYVAKADDAYNGMTRSYAFHQAG